LATDEATRLHLYEQARASWGVEAADALMHALPWDPDQLATKADLALLKTDVAVLRADLNVLEHKLLGAIDRAVATQTKYMVGTTITLVLAMVGTVAGLS
jgi:hypothetical protein